MTTTTTTNSTGSIDVRLVQKMMDACSSGQFDVVQSIVSQHARIYACQQDETTGLSPLMVAASNGHLQIVQYLLETGGAPWNALDRQAKCAGDYATDAQHWGIVNVLVEHATRCELILGRIQRTRRDETPAHQSVTAVSSATKPEYLTRQKLQYTDDGQSLLDEDQDAVMMEWERPIMRAHADILMEDAKTAQAVVRKRVLNVGFGMGIIDTILQEQHQPSHHIIIEAHPDVYKKMMETGWGNKSNVRICFGKWQDVIPQLIAEGVVVDAIFYDTYGEHFLDFEDFHTLLPQILCKPNGVYSFFNGLAPDNLFFHGVACQCVKLQLEQLGLHTEFLPCQIQNVNAASRNNNVWEGVRRKYWHGRDTYYLPIAKWNAQFLATGRIIATPLPDGDPRLVNNNNMSSSSNNKKQNAERESNCNDGDDEDTAMDTETGATDGEVKRQRVG